MSETLNKEAEDRVVEGFRLSPAQRRLWDLQPGGAGRQAQLTLKIEGDLDTKILGQAFRQLIARHEILRTRFYHSPGLRYRLQIVEDDCEPSWLTADLSRLPPPQRAARRDALLREEAARDLDPGREPVLRLLLLTLSEREHLLCVGLPALCADYASLRNLAAELSRAYRARTRGEALDDEPTQYLQFSEWQNEMAEDEGAQVARAYWQQQFSPELLAQAVPFETKPAAEPIFGPRSHDSSLDPATVERLDALTRTQDLDLASFMQTCWRVLLWRHTRQGVSLLGYVCDGRKYEELRDALGLFAACVPVRCRLRHDMAFRELLARVREETGQASRWQEYWSWNDVSRGDGAGGGLAHLAYFPICFEFDEGVRRHPAGDLTLSILGRSVFTDHFKLKLYCARWMDEAGGPRIELQYDPAFVGEDAAECLAAQFRQLAASAAENLDGAIGNLRIVGDDEYRRLLDVNRCARRDYPRAAPFHRLFEAQVERTPDAIALVCEDERLTYAELNARANRLAHRLRRMGVRADSSVGLYLDRSAEAIVALLGILKAGGAYVPLDAAQPGARIAAMLEGAGASIVVTQTKLATRLPGGRSRTVALDAERAALDSESAENPDASVAMENLAYVIFTSGSTGRPKGVAVEHRQLANYIEAIIERAEFPAASSFATVSTLAADLGNTMIFPALRTGGTLHLIPQRCATDAAALGDYFARHGIDCLKIVPSHLEALRAHAQPGAVLPRKRLLVGGEAARREWLAGVLESAPECVVFNHYGPTETTVGVLTKRITKESLARNGPVAALGAPLGNVEVYVLDERMGLAAIGETGEVCVGGEAVSRGYVGRPGQTAEKYLPNPFGAKPGARLYRTGDLGRYLPDGEIEFLGRADDQIKLRGFRIEPGEIESALRQHATLKASLVVTRRDEAGHQRLVAYVSPHKGSAVAADELQEFLRQRLPEYMLPGDIVVLDDLPLTPNGKVDRHALPAPEEVLPPREKTYVAPRTDAEQALAEIWSHVLGLERIGVHDNFFALGGDSILSIQIIARAGRRGLRLTPKQLFQHQTIGQLAAVIGTSAKRDAEQGVVTGDVPLTPVQHLFFEEAPAEPQRLNQYVMLRLKAGADLKLLRCALQKLLDHHDALRLRFTRTASGWRQRNAPLEEITFAHVDLGGVDEAAGQRATIEREKAAAEAGLDLEAGPLLRAVYFDFGPARGAQLLVVVHHLVIDGVSWRVLLEDLQAAYEQLRAGGEVRFPPKTTSFKAWAEGLRRRAQDEDLIAEAAYWAGQDWSEVKPLPVDHAAGSRRARSLEVSLSEDETRALIKDGPAISRAHADETLLAALCRALSAWNGGGTVAVEVEGHGREEEMVAGADLSRTVGWFTTTYPLLLDVPAGEGAAETLRRVKERVRGVPSKGIGYGLLRYLCEREGVRARMRGGAQASFNYLGQFDQVVDNSDYLIAGAEEAVESAEDEIAARHHLQATKKSVCLSVDSMVTGGRLKVLWTYNEMLHERATIERLAEAYLRELRAIIDLSQSSQTKTFTPSDFPQANLSQAELDSFLSSISQRIGE